MSRGNFSIFHDFFTVRKNKGLISPFFDFYKDGRVKTLKKLPDFLRKMVFCEESFLNSEQEG